MKKVGMRNIKTAIAVFICLIISHLLKLEYPFYAAIAAIISMQSSVEGSYQVGKNRMLGTLIGGVVGYGCALISPGNPVIASVGLILVIYICTLLEWKGSVSIAGIVFLAIMVNLKGKPPLQYSVNRVVDTFIGIIVSLLVNYLIFPPKKLNGVSEEK